MAWCWAVSPDLDVYVLRACVEYDEEKKEGNVVSRCTSVYLHVDLLVQGVSFSRVLVV